MPKGQIKKKIRKIHRYLGIFLGIQFLLWTISGLYFSWTNIDEIHGDQFRNQAYKPSSFDELISPSEFDPAVEISSIEIREINQIPYYWINNEFLYNARTGKLKIGITEKEALSVAKKIMRQDLVVKEIELISSTGSHHEYRTGLLPAYVVTYEHDEAIKAYISSKDGAFKSVRHRNWRWFDFLWMTHTMDYEGRDNFNTTVLRVFSLLGLITVLSGFLLWYTSSPSIRKILNEIKKKED